MSMSVGDILSFKDNQTLLGQNILNIYTYEILSIDAESVNNYTAIAQGFWDSFKTELLNVQVDELVHTNILVENLTNEIDFATLVTGDTGGVGTGQADSSFNSFGLVFQRLNKLTRSGGKRIAGVSESAILENNVISSYLTSLEALALKLKACIIIEVGGDEIAQICPIIVGRNPDGSYDLTRTSQVQDVLVNPYVTTQNTRKKKRL